MPIKVAHVVRQYHPSVGGMEDVVQNIAHQQMEAHGQLPAIVTLDRLFRNAAQPLKRKEVVHGVPVMRLSFRGSSRYPLCPAVLEHVRDADVIHVHGIDFLFDFLAATRPIHRRPLVASTHGGFFHTRYASAFKNVYFNTVTRLSSRAYDQVVATSRNDGDIFDAIVKSPRKVVIENGVNVEKYADKAASAPTPTLIYFGRWSENKGLLETIEFFRRLSLRDASWRLIIAGREYDHTQTELMARLRESGLAASTELVPNPSDTELASLIARSSYFICLSRHEGFGIAPIEAMSAGLTPILSDIPPFRRLVEQAGEGVLLEGGDPDRGIADLLALHVRGEQESVRRRSRVQAFAEGYSWKHVGNQYADIYAALADTGRRAESCR